MPWLSDSAFEHEKNRRRAERLNAQRMTYVCVKCGEVGIPQAQRGYALGGLIHENGPWHLPDGRVNPDVCRGKIVWREAE